MCEWMLSVNSMDMSDQYYDLGFLDGTHITYVHAACEAVYPYNLMPMLCFMDTHAGVEGKCNGDLHQQ